MIKDQYTFDLCHSWFTIKTRHSGKGNFSQWAILGTAVIDFYSSRMCLLCESFGNKVLENRWFELTSIVACMLISHGVSGQGVYFKVRSTVWFYQQTRHFTVKLANAFVSYNENVVKTLTGCLAKPTETGETTLLAQ